MNYTTRKYAAIDLKSFYASVECVERGLDPLNVNLVVADASRTEKTICLAVSPALKAYGIPGRARLFEVVSKVKEINANRRTKLKGHDFKGSSIDSIELSNHPEYELTYIAAMPRMALYMEYSARIYSIYLRYVAPEDIFAYSIDEVFIDLTEYENMYKKSALDITKMMVRDVFNETNITATAGVGTNMYLSKVAMDIWAKHQEADEYGARIAYLDEMSYRKLLWSHKPITDFWRVGRGYARKLEQYGLYTMGDIARCSIGSDKEYYNEDLLYKLFGVNAGLLIDHAWGYEPCSIYDVKNYKPENNSISEGQVLHMPYTFDKARIIVREMLDILSLRLFDNGLVTDQIVLTIGYDIENITNPHIRERYMGEVVSDAYGRLIPKHSQKTANLPEPTSLTSVITKYGIQLYDETANKDLLVRRINLTANHIMREGSIKKHDEYEQLSLFVDYDTSHIAKEQEKKALEKEKKIQKAVLETKKRYGNNAILRGTDFLEGATSIARNKEIGGHKA